MLKYILIYFLLIGCGEVSRFDTSGTSPEFIEYIQSFEKDYNINLTGYDVSFKILPDDKAALCRYYSNGHRAVEVDIEYWGYSNFKMRRAMIYHELGHCVFNIREHDSTWIVDSSGNLVPRSLMYPIMVEELGYQRNWEYYKKELWQKSQ